MPTVGQPKTKPPSYQYQFVGDDGRSFSVSYLDFPRQASPDKVFRRYAATLAEASHAEKLDKHEGSLGKFPTMDLGGRLRSKTPDGSPQRLTARLVLVDKRFYQVIAIGDEQSGERFVQSFQLVRRLRTARERRWNMHSVPGCGAAIALPGEPKRTHRDLRIGETTIRGAAYSYQTRGDGVAYTYGCFKVPSQLAIDLPPKQILKAAATEVRRRTSGTAVSDRRLVSGGHPGRAIVLSIPGPDGKSPARVRVRVYWDGSHVHVLEVAHLGKKAPDGAKLFFDAFGLKKPAK